MLKRDQIIPGNRCMQFAYHMSTLVFLLLPACSPIDETDGQSISNVEQSLGWEEILSEVRSGNSDTIQFSKVPVSEEQAQELKIDCEHLRVLHLDQSDITNQLLLEVLKAVPNLEQLKLTGPVQNEQLQTIAKHAGELQVLNLPAGEFDNDSLVSLNAMPKLNLLRFHSPHVSDEGMNQISKLSQLRFLHLINVPITDAGLESIKSMEKLESFYLDGSECTDDGLSDLIKARPGLHFHWNQLHLDHDPKSHQH